jgi:lipoprotein-anchoring transpeptidase ErfK/SrfK
VKHAGSLFCIAACALVAGGSVARVAHADPVPPTTIASGVMIGPVAVGGMTAGDAKTAVKQTYSAPVVVRVAQHAFSVKPVHFHASVPVDAAVQTALTAAANTVVPVTVTLDRSLVKKWVRRVATKSYRAAVPGSILIHNGRPRIFHDKKGHRLRPTATQNLIRGAVLAGTRATIDAPLKVLHAPDIKSNVPIVVVHRGPNRLVLFHGERYVRAFPVATGQAIYPTPLGNFQIIVKELNPWWYPPTQDAWAKGLKPVPPGPGNPLGTRWMGLSTPGVGIHGTSEPWSIGHSESHGCIRMQIPDAEWLYKRVHVGTPVFIIAR